MQKSAHATALQLCVVCRCVRVWLINHGPRQTLWCNNHTQRSRVQKPSWAPRTSAAGMTSFGLRSTLPKDVALVVGATAGAVIIPMAIAPIMEKCSKAYFGWSTNLAQYFGWSEGMSKFAFEFFWGAIKGAISKVVVYPVTSFSEIYRDMSLRAILVSGAPATGSISEFVGQMYAEDGVAAFLMPGPVFKIHLLRYFPTQFTNFMMKDKIKRLVPKYDAKTDFWKFFAVNMASGGIAGALSLSIVYPLDCARDARYWAPPGSALAQTTTVAGAMSQIVLSSPNQSFTALYSGFGVSVVGIMAFRGPYFGLFDFLKERNPWKNDRTWKGMASKFAVAQATAACAGFLGYPLGVLRSGRMMAPGLTPLEILTKVIAAHGIPGLWMGFGFNILRTVGGAMMLVGMDVLKQRLAGPAGAKPKPAEKKPAAKTHDVPPGFKAVILDPERGVLPDVIGEGTHPIGDKQKSTIFCVRPRMYTVFTSEFKSEILSKDSQVVQAEVRMMARPDEARLVDVFKNLGVEYKDLVIPSLVHEELTKIALQLTAQELKMADREKVAMELGLALTDRAKAFHIVLSDFAVVDLKVVCD